MLSEGTDGYKICSGKRIHIASMIPILIANLDVSLTVILAYVVWYMEIKQIDVQKLNELDLYPVCPTDALQSLFTLQEISRD